MFRNFWSIVYFLLDNNHISLEEGSQDVLDTRSSAQTQSRRCEREDPLKMEENKQRTIDI